MTLKQVVIALLYPMILCSFVVVGQEGNSDAAQAKAFALQLIKTADRSERSRLLNTNKHLISKDLTGAITEEGNRLWGRAPWTEVLTIFEVGLEAAELIGDQAEIAEALNSIGKTQKELNAPAKAREAYQRGLKIYEQLGDKAGIARITYNLADVDEGDEMLSRSLSAARESGNKELIAMALGKTGNRHTMRGDYLKATEYLEEAMALRREIGDREAISIGLSNLGILRHQLGDYGEAVKLYSEAINLSHSISDPSVWIDLYNLGNVHSEIGDFAAAMAAYQESLDAHRKANPNDEPAPIVINIANLLVKQGNLEHAEANYIRALTVFERTNSGYGISRSLGGLSNVSEKKGDIRRAIETGERAHQIYLKDNDQAAVQSYIRLARLYHQAGNATKALEYLTESQRLAERSASPLLVFESNFALARFKTLVKDYQGALSSAVAASKALDGSFEREDRWEYHNLLGHIYLGLNRDPEAVREFKKAVDAVEKVRSTVVGDGTEAQRYFTSKLDPYHSLIALAGQGGKDHEIFALSEMIKARSLVESIVDRSGNKEKMLSSEEHALKRRLMSEAIIRNKKLSSELSKQPRNEASLTTLSKELELKRREIEALELQLLVKHPELRVFRGSLEPVAVEQMAGLLSGSDVALSFVVTNEEVVVISLKQDVRVNVTSIPLSAGTLRRRIEAFQTSVASGDLGFQPAGRELYDLLLKPIEKQLQGKTNIIIVPDGPLWDLPFQALMDEKGKFLVEKAAISYAPSLTALREMSKKAGTRKVGPDTELIAFGNPIVGKETKERVQRVFMSEELEPLPEAERLVNELGKMYGSKRSKVLIGNDAREEVAKSETPKYRIVQFATHGILNNTSPMYSHLVLAQDAKNPNEDGLLEAWELKDLDLKADMVILSACDTARGKVSGGEGIIGMTWASFIAGSPTTVASQWKVESSSTTEFMLEFHRQLLAKKRISKAEAMRRAALKLMRMPKYRHPSYWGAWVLVGDGS